MTSLIASSAELIAQIDWEKCQGLIPAIVQDAHSQQVLMLGFMDPKALADTLHSKLITFWSRTSQSYWVKGKTSGNYLVLERIFLDCDQDTLLIHATPQGPTCHLGTASCFDKAAFTLNNAKAETPTAAAESASNKTAFLAELFATIGTRKYSNPDQSYTASLFAQGTKRIAQKVGEEGVEVALAAMAQDRNELINESADLLYHLLVLLQNQQIDLEQVIDCLAARHRK